MPAAGQVVAYCDRRKDALENIFLGKIVFGEGGYIHHRNVYRASAMASVAILGCRSIVNGNMAYDIPDLTKEEYRKHYENDRILPFPREDGTVDVRCSSIPYAPFEEDMKAAEDYWREHCPHAFN